ncbi:MAG: DNA gyrase/topoisomerase IV subunit A [Bacteroidia bacterium]
MSDIEHNDLEPMDGDMEEVLPVSGLYQNWFLDYASYVILDRAVPYLEDGLKPVQRRILHSMYELDDGRFHKVANIIGYTMQYHPHGDQAIGDALVNMGQKDLMVETQGNWGNIYTGDSAAAPRYIEARLTKFALEVAFNPKTTNWQLSYDGRKNEPITLPMKFPLVLAHGVEGIAVGLSTKILPHNFRELVEASIAYLKGRPFKLYPDFPTGGMIDVEGYNHGKRGGKVRVRAKIEEIDKKTLAITEIPYGQTTVSLIDSIVKAHEKGKLKIRKVEDITAKNVNILIHLPPDARTNLTIDALYAFTACESPISPNCCIIENEKPLFTDVRELLKMSTDHTKELLRLELEIKKGELEDKWHMSSLEKIFIENRIYRDIEEEETWEGVIAAIDRGLDPFKHLLFREVTRDDIEKLTEIRIKRISKYDSFKADEAIKKLEEDLEQVKYDLAHLVDFAIAYFEHLLDKYGKGRERRTEIRTFDQINATQVVIANKKLYADFEEGFVGVGTSLKSAQFISDCSDLDDIIVFLKNGAMKVIKVTDKAFVGKGMIHVGVWKKSDERTTYHMIYTDKKDSRTYAKRFHVNAITRDKEYFLTKSEQPGKVHYFSVMPNGEGETVSVKLKTDNKLVKSQFDYDFGADSIKGRAAGGYLVSKFPVNKVEFKSKGVSTLGGINIHYDDIVKRLNTDGQGTYVGNFKGADRILVLYAEGYYELRTFDVTNRWEGRGKILEMCKLDAETVVTAVHQDGESGRVFVKRFRIETSTIDQKFVFIADAEGAKLLFATTKEAPIVEIKFTKKTLEDLVLNLEEFIDVKGWKAVGNKLTDDKIKKIELLSFREPEAKSSSESAQGGGEDGESGGEEEGSGDIPFEIIDARDADEGLNEEEESKSKKKPKGKGDDQMSLF